MSARRRDGTIPVPDLRLGARSASLERLSGVVGSLALLLCVGGFFQDRRCFFSPTCSPSYTGAGSALADWAFC